MMQRACGIGGITGEDQFHRHGLRDSPDEALWPSPTGKEAAHDLRQAKPCFGGTNPDVAQQCQLKTRGQAIAVNRFNERLFHG